MTAQVGEISLWEVECPECKWFGRAFDKHQRAQDYADEHDRLNHPTVEPEDG